MDIFKNSENTKKNMYPILIVKFALTSILNNCTINLCKKKGRFYNVWT